MRSSELRFTRWNEIDWQLWIILEEREQIENVRFSHRGMKMKTQHIVPLSDQGIAVLKRIKALSGHLSFIFPGESDQDKCMSDNTINKALRVMGYDTQKDACDRGFRAMACSVLSESGLWSKEAIEKQMSPQERNGHLMTENEYISYSYSLRKRSFNLSDSEPTADIITLLTLCQQLQSKQDNSIYRIGVELTYHRRS